MIGKVFFPVYAFCCHFVLFHLIFLRQGLSHKAHISHELTMKPRMTLNLLFFASASKVLGNQRLHHHPHLVLKYLLIYCTPLGTHFSNTWESMRQDGFLQIPWSLFHPAAGRKCTAVQGSAWQDPRGSVHN